MIRPVLRMGDARLLTPAAPVEHWGPELLTLIDDMRDTMHSLSGAGLAAPQIGVGLRVVIFELRNNPRYPDVAPIPETILINPVLQPLDDEQIDGWEGCLSVPGMRGLVPRFRRLRYSAMDAYGQPIECEVSDFHARVVQHECDHLDGVLYPTRIRDLRYFGFSDVLFPGLPAEDD